MSKLKKKALSVLMTLVIIAGILPIGIVDAHAVTETWANYASAAFANGDGSAGTPYEITTAEQLAYLAKQVNSGTTYLGKYFVLTTDIDISSIARTWEPIGYVSSVPANDYSFKGHFDGQYHVIKGIRIGGGYSAPNQDYSYAGLFGQTTGGSIKNLGVDTTSTGLGLSVEGKHNARIGALVGSADGTTITNCNSTGSNYVAVGHSTSTTHTGTYKPSVGGLIGTAVNCTIDQCRSDVKVIIGYYADAGGLVGNIASTNIKNSYSVSPAGSGAAQAVYVNSDMVVGSEPPCVGGLVGNWVHMA